MIYNNVNMIVVLFVAKIPFVRQTVESKHKHIPYII